jgi:nicotinate phosphoribosyltransferase
MNRRELERRGLPDGGLWLDRYHVDSMQIAWQSGIHHQATFDLFARRNPYGGAYILTAGLELALDFAASFRYSDEDIAYLASLGRYDAGFLDWLRDLRFTGDIDAIPEGAIAFADEPLLRVTGPFAEALALEAGLLHLIGISSAIATKAARMVHAAAGKPIADFSLRRAHHPWLTTRSAMLAGFASTSNLDAARDLHVPASGTVPHALIEAYTSEEEAFCAIARAFARYSLLLDTYDVSAATRLAIAVANETLQNLGHRLESVRIDSGDLQAQAFDIRHELDSAGWPETQILASGDLDDTSIAALVASGAPVDGFGVGGRLVTPEISSNTISASMSTVYKLVWLEGTATPARMKLSDGKMTWPGRKQIARFADWTRDLVLLENEPIPAGAQPLLIPVMRGGTPRITPRPTFQDLQAFAARSLSELPAPLAALAPDTRYEVAYSDALHHLREETRQRLDSQATRS